MATAKVGDRVRVHLRGRLADGTVFDSTEDGGAGEWTNFRGAGVAFAPAEVTVGEGALLPAVEAALVGLSPGQQVTVAVPCAEAYGARRPGLVAELPRAALAPAPDHLVTFRVDEGRQHPNVFLPKVGDVLSVTSADGAVVPARVQALTDRTITLDANHPLAGHDLTFEVRLVAIV